MNAEFDILEDDAETFFHHHAHHSPIARRFHRRARLTFLGALVIIFALASYTFVSLSDQPMTARLTAAAPLILLPIAAFALARLFFGSLERVSERAMLRSHRRGDHGKFTGHYSLRADDSGLTMISSRGESRTAWHAVHRIDDGPAHVFVYFSPTSALTIPKRAFPAPGEPETFARFLRDHHARASPQPSPGT